MVNVGAPEAGDVNLTVIVGGQFGSEAKGHITKRYIKNVLNLAKFSHRTVPLVFNVRVAGPNAGHSAMDKKKRMWALRQVPIGVVVDQSNVRLHIAAGSEVEMEVLLREIDNTEQAGLNSISRLSIDPEVTLIDGNHHQTEADQRMQERIGSTGKGVGAARAERIMRTAKRLIDDPQAMDELTSRGVKIHGLTINGIHQESIRLGCSAEVVIEGTQGFGLGMHAGYYPQCTSSDCRAIDFLSMAGMSPWDPAVNLFRVVVVTRVFPIRVAGNSGPLAYETSWEDLGLQPELTTVTRKVRRVAEWDSDLVKRAVAANGGPPIVMLAVTMIDQKWPELQGVTTKQGITRAVRTWLREVVEAECGAPVLLATTGPDTGVWFHVR